LPMFYAVAFLSLSTTLMLFVFWYRNRDLLSKMKWYPNASPFAVGISMSFIPFFIFMSMQINISLLLPALFISPFLFRAIIAGMTYVARVLDAAVDAIKREAKGELHDAKLSRYDFVALFLGVLFGTLYMV